MKQHLVALLALACAGCSPVVTRVNVPDMDKSASLHVSDMRVPTEKQDKIFSLLITSKEYGVMRVGDARLSPSAVRLLQHEAFKKLGADGKPHDVTVYHFVIYQNMRAQLRAGAIGAGFGGVIGASVANAMANHDATAQTHIVDEMAFNSVTDEYLRGTYSPAENPDKGSVFIVYVDTEIDGKKVFTRTLTTMKAQPNHDALTDAVELAIANHLSQYGVAKDASTSMQGHDGSQSPSADRMAGASP
ncbi:hypothetical protein [Dyella terrae]|nr:hypothetical protein [Dyella terrae]TBR36198.1 hypothetical protein EYV96_16540 [Dyella terrae]